MHPGALYLLGTVFVTGDCVKQDMASAMWCFHRASEKVIVLEVSFWCIYVVAEAFLVMITGQDTCWSQEYKCENFLISFRKPQTFSDVKFRNQKKVSKHASEIKEGVFRRKRKEQVNILTKFHRLLLSPSLSSIRLEQKYNNWNYKLTLEYFVSPCYSS